MYENQQFSWEMMFAQEDKPTNNKMWTDAKDYFEGEIKKIETYQNNINGTTGRSKYENVTNMTDTGDQLQEYLDSLKTADKAQQKE